MSVKSGQMPVNELEGDRQKLRICLGGWCLSCWYAMRSALAYTRVPVRVREGCSEGTWSTSGRTLGEGQHLKQQDKAIIQSLQEE